MPLSNASTVAFLGTKDLARAKTFFTETLGLRLVEDASPYAIVLAAGTGELRLSAVPELPKPLFTYAGWEVSDIEATVRTLTERGVTFNRYPNMGITQDELGIWTAPNGDKVAWFHDPDGNILGVSQQVRLKK